MVLRIISVVVALVAFITYSSLFVVDERQKALVLQFGQVADVKEEPGLAFKPVSYTHLTLPTSSWV